MKKFLLLSLVVASLTANEQKIAVQNSILAKVNGNTISMMDVKKKMDILFHQHYSHLEESPQAKLQFYQTSWRQCLMEAIDSDLIVADAEDKGIKLTDGEIREDIENRFGPNVMSTLDDIGITYDEAWKMTRKEMIVQRMSWWFVHSKAIQSVTPQDIRQAYRLYLQENPPYTDWKYRAISIRTEKPDDMLAEKVYLFLHDNGNKPETISLKEFDAFGASIQVSNEYKSTDKELTDAHKAALVSLNPGEYSRPSLQTSRVDKKTVYRIFYLIEKEDHPAPTFNDLSTKLRNQLTQKATEKELKAYLDKVRKKYGFDSARLKETVPDDLHPFSIQ